ncbi:nuclear transport factor 2 family protein [Nocardia sp. CA2R105]|uniref:nuclear transport factor 2 family protein n=1 Tax=Nocardia coffeae TaxID=2873381 RepID=UPI001CA61C30|nr:nuclear transport factor 2 family protein [Nocardia coffeae]MBY8860948.1 nuclear transport factor 2 family protein [Nocardia coffeae]
MNATTPAEVAHGVHTAIASYTQALDAGRTDDIVALFSADGSSEIAGVGVFEGHEALRAAYAGMIPTAPQRHMTANTVITSRSADEAAATSDLVFLLRGENGWAVQLLGRYEDLLVRDGQTWLFRSRKLSLTM